jgi:hypothetical protein
MGTNYYWHPPAPNRCEHCGRADEVSPLHIGKSSAGWCFSLHILPDQGINDLPDWEARWATPGSHIEDEYGSILTTAGMRAFVTERSFPPTRTWTPGEYAMNHAEPGPNGLLRHRIGPHCVGHGAGTWDLIPGSFS